MLRDWENLLGNQLHAAVVNNHVIMLNMRIFLSHIGACLQKETIRNFPAFRTRKIS